MVSWFYLIGAGILEAFWPMALKASNGFTKPLASLVAISIIAAGMFLFSLAVKTISPAMAYIIFVGMGAVGVTIVGITLGGENFNFLKAFFVLMILSGIIGLNYFFGK